MLTIIICLAFGVIVLVIIIFANIIAKIQNIYFCDRTLAPNLIKLEDYLRKFETEKPTCADYGEYIRGRDDLLIFFINHYLDGKKAKSRECLFEAIRQIALSSAKEVIFTENPRRFIDEAMPSEYTEISLNTTKGCFQTYDLDKQSEFFWDILATHMIYDSHDCFFPRIIKNDKMKEEFKDWLDPSKFIEFDESVNNYLEFTKTFRYRYYKLAENFKNMGVFRKDFPIDRKIYSLFNLFRYFNDRFSHMHLFISLTDRQFIQRELWNAYKALWEKVSIYLSEEENGYDLISDGANFFIGKMHYLMQISLPLKKPKDQIEFFSRATWLEIKSFIYQHLNSRSLDRYFRSIKENISVKKEDSLSFSSICNRYKEHSIEREQGLADFLDLFLLFTDGNLILLSKILCAINKEIDSKKYSRIIGIADSGTILATIVSVSFGKPLSLLNIAPYFGISPLPFRKEPTVVIEESYRTGFTLKTIVPHIQRYIPMLKPRIIKIICGAVLNKKEKDGFIKNIFALSSFQEKEITDRKRQRIEVTNIKDSKALNLKQEDYQDYYRLLVDKLNTYKKVEDEILEKTIRKITTRRKNYFDAEALLNYPDVLLYISHRFFKRAIEESGSISIIIGSKNAVPYGTGVGMIYLANKNINHNFEKKISTFVLAKANGTILPYLSTIPENDDIIIVDTIIKDGIVVRNIVKRMNGTKKKVRKIRVICLACSEEAEMSIKKLEITPERILKF